MEDGCSNGSSRQLPKTSPVSKHLEVSNHRKQPNKGVSFIKVLGHDFSKHLQIPEEFTRNFNGYIPHRFILENAMTKKCWRVEVEEDEDGRMYFQNGWGEFVEAHLLEAGNFLVFEYEEQSIFLVKIYGRNGCEKTLADATLGSNHERKKNTACEEIGERIASDYERKKPKKNSKKNLKKRPQQKMRKLPLKKNGRGIHKKQHAGDRIRIHSDKRGQRTTNVSISENSVSFSITMHKRKKHQFHQVHIPKAVLNKLSSNEKVVLRVAKDNCWPIKLTRREDGRGIFSQGWKDFLTGNGISPGDTLYFELISNNQFQVNVTRASEIEHHCDEAKYKDEASGSSLMDCEDDEQVICTTNDKAVEASITTKRVLSEPNSSFSITCRNTATAGCYLYIPKAVAVHQKLNNKESVVLRDPERKCWPIEVRKWSEGRVGLTKGWPEFWKGHGITAGDTLSFEFVSEYLIQVTINRAKPLEQPAIELGAVVTSDAVQDDKGAANQLEATEDDGAAKCANQLEATDDKGAANQLEAMDNGGATEPEASTAPLETINID